MINKENAYTAYGNENEESVDLVVFLLKYLRFWKWFLLSVVVCLLFAFFYLRYVTPVYEVNTTVLIKDDQKGGGMDDMKAFQQLGLFNVKNNVDNEVQVLQTGTLMENVVKRLGLYVSYFHCGPFRETEVYGKECPVLFTLPVGLLDTISTGYSFKLKVHPDGKLLFYNFESQNKSKTHFFLSGKENLEIHASRNDSVVTLPFGFLRMETGAYYPKEEEEYNIIVRKPINVALGIIGNLSVQVTGKTTSVVNIKLKSPIIHRALELLKTYIEVYNQDDMNDQSLVAQNTAKFIEKRLSTLTRELSDVEQDVQNYKQREKLTDLSSDAQLLLDKSKAIDEKRMDVETQLSIINDLENYFYQKENENQLLPSGTGIESEFLNQLISNYNQLILQRNKLSRTAAPGNQAMIDLTDQINSLAHTVKTSIAREKQRLSITNKDIDRQYGLNTSLIKSVPRKEREYLEIQRQQSVKSELYLFLLQKKEENYLTMTSVVPKAKIIDQPRASASPISPKKPLIMLMAFVLGLAIPVLVLFVRERLRYYIENKEELVKITNSPVLGEIPKAEGTGNVLLHEHSTSSLAEMFRLLRTNLLFLLGKENQKVVMVTSSISGEGKTFLTINLGLSLAFLKKKVLLVNLDLRKPKMSEFLGIESKTGMSMFLSGSEPASHLIRSSGINPYLDVILAGPIPPNPNELLDSIALDQLIEQCKQTYDYILLDTAPVGAVSDTFLVNRFADVTLYLIRAEYTSKQSIIDADELREEGKLNRMFLVLNASDVRKSGYYGYGNKYGYGYGRKYGYGKKYGYGYGYGGDSGSGSSAQNTSDDKSGHKS